MPGATRSLADSTVTAAEPGPALDTHSTHYARDPALVAAVGFFLVGKLSRMVVLVWYAIALPLFRSYFCLQAVYQLLNALIYFPILFIRGRPGAIAALATLGMVTDYFPRYLSWIPMRMAHNLISEKRNQHTDLELSNLGNKVTDRADTPETDWRNISWYIPASNVEHFVERMAAFVVIVLGEIVLSVVYTASEGQTGLSRVYGTASFALLVAFNFCWLYFDADCTTEFIHAMHRHWFTSVTYTNLHFPLCAALIIVAAATYKMTQHPNKITPVIGWYFSGGLGVALISLALIGITHRGLDPKGTTRLGRFTQFGFRITTGVVIICLPLFTDVTALFMLGNSAGLTTVLVIEETYGKMRRGEPVARPFSATHTSDTVQDYNNQSRRTTGRESADSVSSLGGARQG